MNNSRGKALSRILQPSRAFSCRLLTLRADSDLSPEQPLSTARFLSGLTFGKRI